MGKKRRLKNATTSSEQMTDSERRQFIAVASKFSGILATLGLTTTKFAEGATGGKSDPLVLLFHAAIDTGDMEMAIKKYGSEAKLNKTQMKALRSLTRAELTVLKRIREKLMPIGERLDSLKITK